MNEQSLKALVTKDVSTLGQIIVWDKSNHSNYLEARESGATYITSSSLDMFADMESSCSGFLDFMEVRDSMDDAGMPNNFAYGILVDLAENTKMYVDLDIIHAKITGKMENCSLQEIAEFSIEVACDFDKHKQDLDPRTGCERVEKLVQTFKAA